MNIELLPVIEIGYFNQGVEAPLNRPFWDYPQEWDAYWKKLLSLAGLTMPMESYIPGASIFSPTLISDANLRKIVNNHLSSSSGDEPDWSDLLPLDGGYVLGTDGSDRLFPQCCSDLGSFDSWRRVL